MTELLYTGYLPVKLQNVNNGLVFLIFGIILYAAISYLLGSLNFAIIISKLFYKKDIRTLGSKNAGATNMKRSFGLLPAVFTLLGDMLKAVISVFGGRLLFGFDFACIFALCCALGHAFPVYYKFKGGKCVAVTAASLLCLDWLTFVIILIIFAIMVLFTKYISLGSIFCAFMAPIILYNRIKTMIGMGTFGIFFVFLTCMLVVALHKENIKRLRNGKENKFSFSGKK